MSDIGLDPQLKLGPAQYPKPELAASPGALLGVPSYTQAFRIAVPATVQATATSGSHVTVAAVLTYQACDDRLCYPSTSAPVRASRRWRSVAVSMAWAERVAYGTASMQCFYALCI